MTTTYLILTAIFIIVSVALILIILVQRPAGGGLAGAFGGAGGGGGTESVFGGRVGDALTVMTVVAFCVYLGLAIALNLLESRNKAPVAPPNLEETLLPLSATDPFEIPGDADPTSTAPAPGTAIPPATPGTGPADDGVFIPNAQPAATPDGEGS